MIVRDSFAPYEIVSFVERLRNALSNDNLEKIELGYNTETRAFSVCFWRNSKEDK